MRGRPLAADRVPAAERWIVSSSFDRWLLAVAGASFALAAVPVAIAFSVLVDRSLAWLLAPLAAVVVGLFVSLVAKREDSRRIAIRTMRGETTARDERRESWRKARSEARSRRVWPTFVLTGLVFLVAQFLTR